MTTIAVSGSTGEARGAGGRQVAHRPETVAEADESRASYGAPGW